MTFSRSWARLLGWLACTSIVAAPLGCSDDERAEPLCRLPGGCDATPPCEDGETRECATEYYFSGYEPARLPSCTPQADSIQIAQRVTTVLFHGQRIDHAELRHQTRALQRYFEPHDLWFETEHVSQPYAMRYAMRGSEDEFGEALQDAGIPTAGELTPEQLARAEDIVADIMYQPVRDFLAEFATEESTNVNVLVLEHIVDPDLEELLGNEGAKIVGLGLSPALFERATANDPSSPLYRVLGVGTTFTPTLLVGHETIVDALEYPDAVIAHEMGHALGLPHLEEDGNLMEPYLDTTCRGTLTQTQIDLMGPFRARVADPRCGRPNLADLGRRVTERVLARRRARAATP